MDAVHIVAGVVVQLGCALLFRTSLASWRPWLIVAALELVNEAHNFWVERWPSPGMQIGESVRDVLLTLALPTLLLLIARHAPRLLAPSRTASADAEAGGLSD